MHGNGGKGTKKLVNAQKRGQAHTKSCKRTEKETTARKVSNRTKKGAKRTQKVGTARKRKQPHARSVTAQKKGQTHAKGSNRTKKGPNARKR